MSSRPKPKAPPPISLQLLFPGGERGEHPQLEVSNAGSRVLLRCECPVRGGGIRLDPRAAGGGTFLPVEAASDAIDWCLAQLDTRGGELLAQAGFGDAASAFEVVWKEERETTEAALRNPPCELDALDLDQLRARRSEKWNTYPKDITPAWVAEMDFPLCHPVRRVLKSALDGDDLGYPLAPRETGVAEAFAERMEQRFDWSVDPARVELIADVVQGQYISLEAFSQRGDGVVVQPPIYPPFLGSVRNLGRTLVPNGLVQEASGHHIDFDALLANIDDSTRMLLLCNPHNPSGRVFTSDELSALALLAAERDWIVVSDEIHADLVFDGRQHIPFASLGDEIAARTLTLTSATKAFNIPGLRCCVAHFGSAELQQRFNAAVPRAIRGGMNLLGQYATVAAWRHGQPWLDAVHRKLVENRARVTSFFAEHCPQIVAHVPEATYLTWLDCRALELTPSPARFFYEHAGVALSDGRAFGEGYDGYARLNFATGTPILEDILARIAAALGNR